MSEPGESTREERVINHRYRLESLLGRGGMGKVYLAVDRLTREVVALKSVTTAYFPVGSDSPYSHPHLALAQEFKVLASLRHPHIISVLDYGFDERRHPFFSMEFLDGAENLLEAARRLSREQQIDLLLQVLQALAYLHRHQVLHRDLKPANVLVHQDNVKLLDFGLSVSKGEMEEHSDGVTGTIAYLAPELLDAKPASEASDLYSVGVMAYEIFAGRHPFHIERLGLLLTEIATKPVSFEEVDLDERIVAVLKRLLSKNPDERYRDALQVVGAFCAATGRSVPQTTAIRESFLRSARFVGRGRELGKLERCLKEAREGRGSAWLIAGESGVGKSRFLGEMRTLALVTGVGVHRGQAVSDGGGPFEVWREPLRRLVLLSAPRNGDAGVLKTLVPDMDVLLEENVDEAPPLPPPEAQERLQKAVESTYRCAERPIVVLLEDMHWSDDESLAILDRLGKACSRLPILILASYRDDERPDLPERLPGLEVLKLARLDAGDIAELADSMLGDAGRRGEVVDLLERETEGNAFFVVEVVRALAEEAGRLEDIGQRPLPQRIAAGGIAMVIEKRLGRVPPWARPALETAGVLGRRPELVLLAALHPELEIDAWLEVCAVAAVLNVRDGRWQFAHDKLREGLLRSLPQEKRRALHRRVAEALERNRDDSPERTVALANHFLRAELWSPAALYSGRAGDDARRLHALAQARRHYQDALTALSHMEEDDPLRRSHIDHLLGLVRAALFADGPEVNLERLAQAEKLLGELADTEDEDTLRRARLFHSRGRCHYLRGETREAIGAWRQVLPLAAQAGDEELRALPSSVIGRALAVQGDYARAEELLERAIEPLEQLGAWPDWISTVGFYGACRASRGDYPAGVATVRKAIARARETRNPAAVIAAKTILAILYRAGQEHDKMLKIARQVVRQSQKAGEKLYLYIGHGLSAWALGKTGDIAAAREATAQAHELSEALGGKVLLFELLAAGESEIALAAGEPEEALALAERAVTISEASDNFMAEAIARVVWAQALHALRPRESEEIDAHFETAVRHLESGDLRIEKAWAQLVWGRIRRDRGQHRRSRQLLRQASSLHAMAGLPRIAAWDFEI